jgi:hypothetical protein
MRASSPPPPGCQLRDVLKAGGQASQAANSLERVQQITRHSQRVGAHNESELAGNLGSAQREHSQNWVLSVEARTLAERVQRKEGRGKLGHRGVRLMGRLRSRPSSVQGLTKPLGVGRQT